MISKAIYNGSWYFPVLALIAAVALSVFLYRRVRKNEDVPKGAANAMMALRAACLFIAIMLLADLVLRQLRTETENPVILLAVDNSNSVVAGSDSARKREALNQNIGRLRADLGDKFQVRTIYFGAVTRTSEDPAAFSEKETDLENLFNDVSNNYSNQNVGALILASDGIFTKGGNPSYKADKLGYPVFTIALGDTAQQKDAVLQKVEHNHIAYLGNDFPVAVNVRAKKLAGQKLVVSLYDGKELKGSQQLAVNASNFLGRCTFTLQAQKAGTQRFTARIAPAGQEENISNNWQSFEVEVLDNKDKILLLYGAVHPDIAAINEALVKGTSYQVDQTTYDNLRVGPKAYNLVILHGAGIAQKNLIQQCENEQVPYWIVNPQTTEHLPGLRILSNLGRHNDTEPVASKSFGYFNVSAELSAFINQLPAVSTFFGTYQLSNGAQTLISQKVGAVETQNPILYFYDVNGLKRGVFAGDGLWKWKFRDFAEHHNHKLFSELIVKTTQYLAVKEDKSFFRVHAPRRVNENDEIELEAEVYNKSYEAITDPDVTLRLMNADGRVFNYTFSKTENAYKLRVGVLPAGEYRYQSQVKINDEVHTRAGSFLVKEVNSEFLNTVADHNLLQNISRLSGGKSYLPSKIDSLSAVIMNNEVIKPVTYSHVSTADLIDIKWLFFSLLILLSIEWFLRKRFLTI